MNYNEPAKPTLVEPGVKYFIHETLKKCNEYRVVYKNHLFNLGMLAAFVLVIVIVLVYKYKGKMSPQETRARDNEKKQYILSKINNYKSL